LKDIWETRGELATKNKAGIRIYMFSFCGGFTNLEISTGVSGDQLLGNVLAPRDVRLALGHGDHVVVRLPVPVRDVRERAGRGRVSHPGRGHDAGGLAGPLRPLHDGRRAVALGHRGRTVGQAHFGRDADRGFVVLDAAQIGRGRARRIGHLAVHAIRLSHNNNRSVNETGRFIRSFVLFGAFRRLSGRSDRRGRQRESSSSPTRRRPKNDRPVGDA